jgi:hypothetical protein
VQDEDEEDLKNKQAFDEKRKKIIRMEDSQSTDHKVSIHGHPENQDSEH